MCKVVGKVVSTIRHASIREGSLVLVRRLGANGRFEPGVYAACDTIGCGTGSIVLVTEGSNARFVLGAETSADMAVLGIVDSYDLPESNEENQ